MTSRTTVTLAGTAATVAVLALVARPLLPHHTPVPLPSRRPAATTAPASVLPVAVTAATTALACPPSRHWSRDTDCGAVQVSRRQATCRSDTSCQVQLIGTLTTHSAVIPVALTITLTDTAGGWQAVEVSS